MARAQAIRQRVPEPATLAEAVRPPSAGWWRNQAGAAVRELARDRSSIAAAAALARTDWMLKA